MMKLRTLRVTLAAVLATTALSVGVVREVRAATITVTTTTDEVAPNGSCSLREAIIATNTNAPSGGCAAGSSTAVDIINLPPGTYALTLLGTAEDAAADGDLDLTGDVTIQRTGTESPVIDGSATGEAVFAVTNFNATVRLIGLTITGGSSGVVTQGSLEVNSSVIEGNTGPGVHVLSDASAGIAYSSIVDNGTGVLIEPGAIESRYTLVLSSTVAGNGSGIESNGRTSIENSTISGNTGHGLALGSFASASLAFSTVALNGNTGISAVAPCQDDSLNGGPDTCGSCTGSCGYGPYGSIVALNTVDCAGAAPVEQSANLASDASCPGFTFQNTDPKLGRLRVNPDPSDPTFQPTPTHALLYGSPARDAAGEIPDLCPVNDQRFVSRPLDGTGDGLALCDIGAYEADTLTGTPFTDIGASIFQTEIGWLYHAAVTFGCNVERTLFCPTVTVTREQMASFLVRALDLPPPPPSEPNGGDYFVDDESSIHEADINALRYANITTGCGTDNVPGSPTIGQPIYCPGLTVTREQMATFISRARALPDPPPSEPNGGDYFTDDDDPDSALHEPHINRLRYAQITRGCNEAGTLYCPDLPVTREQMAAFLYRALND